MSGDEYRSIVPDGLRPVPRDRDRGEPGRYESMERRGGDRLLAGETVDRLGGGGEPPGDVDFGGDDLTSNVSEDILFPFNSSTGFFSGCSAGRSAPFCWGVDFPVSGGDTIDEGYLPEYLKVGNSLYVSIINIIASACKQLTVRDCVPLRSSKFTPYSSHHSFPPAPFGIVVWVNFLAK